ncbi:MAG: dihydrofolate reductase family protein, partial [Pseudonocardiaceae bacterium]
MEHLLRACDVILHGDGTVDEVIPESHGAGALSLSPVALHTGPRSVLTTLYQQGVRSVVLSGGSTLASPFLGEGLVDRVLVHIGSEGPSGKPTPDADCVSLLPPGFQLTEVLR